VSKPVRCDYQWNNLAVFLLFLPPTKTGKPGLCGRKRYHSAIKKSYACFLTETTHDFLEVKKIEYSGNSIRVYVDTTKGENQVYFESEL
jgi:hypothetical protein